MGVLLAEEVSAGPSREATLSRGLNREAGMRGGRQERTVQAGSGTGEGSALEPARRRGWWE